MFGSNFLSLMDTGILIIFGTVYMDFAVSTSSNTCGAFLSDNLVPVGSRIFNASSSSEGPGVPLINSSDVWCAGTVNSNQYLTVDLGEIVTAREVSVGGKKGSQRSVAEYYVLTSLDGVSYTAIRDYSAGGGIKPFDGSLLDGNAVNRQTFPSPVECRYVRFNPREPLTPYPNFLCMRVEVYGCLKPVNGGLTQWSSWSVCSKNCDGTQTRNRNCTDPPAAHGGADCVGERSENRRCNVGVCASIPPTDLVFAISASAVAADANFQFMKSMINRVVDKWSTYKARYSIVTYGKHVHIKLSFNQTFPNDNSLKRYINSTQRSNSSEALPEAITESKKVLEDPASRPGASKVLVIMLDKDSVTSEANLSAAVRPLTDAGIKVIVVTIGNDTGFDKVGSIAKDTGNIIRLNNADNVVDAADELMKKIIEAVNIRGYGAWGTWGACSKTCRFNGEAGLQTRMRVCRDPSAGCSGPGTQKRVCGEQNCPGCGELGTGNSSLPDEAFQASSEFSKDTSASAGRLGSSSAWCARPGDSSMHLQVDLGSDVRVYRVATQGKEPGEHLWVSVYKVSFSKDGTTWSFYSENGVVKNFKGNSDATTKKFNDINTTETYRHIRVHPLSWRQKASNKPACLRLGVIGCVLDVTPTAAPRDEPFKHLWLIVWILAGVLTLLLLICLVYVCCWRRCCAGCCAKYCGCCCCCCSKDGKNKQRKVAHASRSGSCITDGTTKVFVPLTDEKERETQEVTVVLGNETAGDLGTIEFDMERVTQISKRRGSQENLIMTEMPSYLASQDGFNEMSKYSADAKGSRPASTPPTLPTYALPQPFVTGFDNKGSDDRLVDVAMEIQPVVRDARRASEPAVRALAMNSVGVDNGYHSETEEQFGSGLGSNLAGHGNPLVGRDHASGHSRHGVVDVSIETRPMIDTPQPSNAALTDAQGTVTGHASRHRSANGNLVIKVPIYTEELIDEQLDTSPENKMRYKIGEARM